MARVQIPVSVIEFDERGRTIWVQSPNGGTVLRIQLPVGIRTSRCEDTADTSHMDIAVTMPQYGGLIPPTFCLAKDADLLGHPERPSNVGSVA